MTHRAIEAALVAGCNILRADNADGPCEYPACDCDHKLAAAETTASILAFLSAIEPSVDREVVAQAICDVTATGTISGEFKQFKSSREFARYIADGVIRSMVSALRRDLAKE